MQSVSLRCLISLSDLVTWLEKLKLRVWLSPAVHLVYSIQKTNIVISVVLFDFVNISCLENLQIFVTIHLAGMVCPNQQSIHGHFWDSLLVSSCLWASPPVREFKIRNSNGFERKQNCIHSFELNINWRQCRIVHFLLFIWSVQHFPLTTFLSSNHQP